MCIRDRDSSISLRRPASTTVHPFCTSASALCLPTPELAPVTIAILSAMSWVRLSEGMRRSAYHHRRSRTAAGHAVFSAFLHDVEVREHVHVDVALDDHLALRVLLVAAHPRLARGVPHHPGHGDVAHVGLEDLLGAV